MTSMKQGQPQHYTSSFGPVSGPICGALGALVAAGAVRVAELPMWLPLLPALVAVVATVTVGAARNTAEDVVMFRSACWAAAASWAVWVAWRGWSLWALLALALLALVAGMLAPVFAHEREQPVEDERASRKLALEAEWAALISRVLQLSNGTTVDVTDVRYWPNSSGYTLVVDFPLGTLRTYEELQKASAQLAAAKKLPTGCPVRVEEGEIQGSALVHVSTLNDLKTVIPFPADYRPRSVRDEFAIGHFRDRQPALVELYQSAGVVAGVRGSGKTVVLHTITGQLVKCVDAVVWHVDLNGGSISAPWMYLNACGLVEGDPPIDWVATNAAEAIRVAEVGTAIAKDRKARYQGRMAREDTDILPVGPDLPAIIIIVDEGGEVFGESASKEAQRAADALRELQRIGRAVCVNVIFSVQRAVGTYVPSDLKKGAMLSICMRVKDDAEIAHLLDWDRGLRVADLKEVGTGYLKRSDTVPAMFKGFRTGPEQIFDTVRNTAGVRTPIDEPARRKGGRVYAERWDRLQPWLDALRRGEDVELLDGDEPAGAADEPAMASPEPTRPANRYEAQADAVRARMREMAERSQQAAAKPEPAEKMPEWAREVQAGLDRVPVAEPVRPRDEGALAKAEAGWDDPLPEQVQEAIDEAPTRAEARRAFIVKMIDRAGPEGMVTKDVIEQVWSRAPGGAIRRQGVNEDLALLREKGEIVLMSRGRWCTPRNAQAA
jgi:hypothetical protein